MALTWPSVYSGTNFKLRASASRVWISDGSCHVYWVGLFVCFGFCCLVYFLYGFFVNFTFTNSNPTHLPLLPTYSTPATQQKKTELTVCPMTDTSLLADVRCRDWYKASGLRCCQHWNLTGPPGYPAAACHGDHSLRSHTPAGHC